MKSLHPKCDSKPTIPPPLPAPHTHPNHPSFYQSAQKSINNKGRVRLPKRKDFRENSKQPLNPPHFRKIMLQLFFLENVLKKPI